MGDHESKWSASNQTSRQTSKQASKNNGASTQARSGRKKWGESGKQAKPPAGQAERRNKRAIRIPPAPAAVAAAPNQQQQTSRLRSSSLRWLIVVGIAGMND